jgi:flagellar basal-body rod protein FlgB
VARDFKFDAALRDVMDRAGSGRGALAGHDAGHLRTWSSQGGVSEQVKADYTVQTQPSLDGNSVDLDQQRANFTENAIQYESTLRFINGHVKTMLAAIQGQ